MNDHIPRLLKNLNAGEEQAANELFTAVFEELRRIAAKKLAAERPGHTLQATALVNEAYIKLSAGNGSRWANKAHFFGSAAEAMRRILVDSARRKNQIKRGKSPSQVELAESQIVSPVEEDKLLLVHEAVDELALEDAIAAEVVKLRFFVGLNHQETAHALEMSETSVRRHWTVAKLLLHRIIQRIK